MYLAHQFFQLKYDWLPSQVLFLKLEVTVVIFSPGSAMLEGKEEIRHFFRQCPYNSLPCNFFYRLERTVLHENDPFGKHLQINNGLDNCK